MVTYKGSQEKERITMAFAPESVSFDRGDKSILGGFYEKEHGNWFEFSRNDDGKTFSADGFMAMFAHKVWVGDVVGQGFRYANVKKTVAYVCVDEDEFGTPVMEKWQLKKNNEYV
jgi:hypothetical protein